MVNVGGGGGAGAQELTIDQEATPPGRRSIFQLINARGGKGRSKGTNY